MSHTKMECSNTEELIVQLIDLLLSEKNTDADTLYERDTSSNLLLSEYEILKTSSHSNLKEIYKIALGRDELKSFIQEILHSGNICKAYQLWQNSCSRWWRPSEFQLEVNDRIIHLKKAHASLVKAHSFTKADLFYEQHLAKDIIQAITGLDTQELKYKYYSPLAEYNNQEINATLTNEFIDIYQFGNLSELDSAYRQLSKSVDFNVNEYLAIKQAKLRQYLTAMGMDIQLDQDQESAISRPETRLLIQARAGSGKTRTLCARAALAISDENLDPNQVLVLAFNKSAAQEVNKRIQRMGGIRGYNNARTFHSLAHQLLKSKKELLFDSGDHASEQKQASFIERLIQRILSPAFKTLLYEYFRKELQQLEKIGRDLPPSEFIAFRRSLKSVSLKGDQVKSNGEKYIADFLFEHGIEFEYEKVFDWKTGFDGESSYRPDFSILANGQDYILEHWALNPNNPDSELPEHWETTAKQYRQQIDAKRKYWEDKPEQLIETHSLMLKQGRESFEQQLKDILTRVGIKCERLPQDVIIERVFNSHPEISRMANLFLQFIHRAKCMGWSANDAILHINNNPDPEEKARIFHQLALRVYREYETALNESQDMDFDDFLSNATEKVKTQSSSISIHLGDGEKILISDLRWIMIDEYQDFSELYYQLLEAILKVNPDVRLVCVGDDWQAINAFAGADIRFFSDFSEYFTLGNTVSVATNYRSNFSVVSAGNKLMQGLGNPAKVNNTETVPITIMYPQDIWIERRPALEFDQTRLDDTIYLPPRRKKDQKVSNAELELARVLKLCTNLIRENPSSSVLLLARTGIAYGMSLWHFRKLLIQVASKACGIDEKHLEVNIKAMTAHKSKGQEADTVIILKADKNQFPKIHPDNMLFAPFGVTLKNVLDEEQRLFYVAVSRAKQNLFILASKGKETPYWSKMTEANKYNSTVLNNVQLSTNVMGTLAQEIQTKLNSIPNAGYVSPWSFIKDRVSNSLSPLIDMLEKNNIPIPKPNYYLSDQSRLCGDLAWPDHKIVILADDNIKHTEEWHSNDWSPPRPGQPFEKTVNALKRRFST